MADDKDPLETASETDSSLAHNFTATGESHEATSQSESSATTEQTANVEQTPSVSDVLDQVYADVVANQPTGRSPLENWLDDEGFAARTHGNANDNNGDEPSSDTETINDSENTLPLESRDSSSIEKP